MAKISTEAQELYEKTILPYKNNIISSSEKEQNFLRLIKKDLSGIGYKKLLLCDEMIYQASMYMIINSLSVKFLEFRNNDVLNDARKALYKAIIYLEEIVSNSVDISYSELEDRVAEISNTPLEKRYYQIRKLGLAISMLKDAFGENSKWKWSFVEVEGRFAVVAKNMIDMKQATKSYFDSCSPDYESAVFCLRLIKSLLGKSATSYRERYELSTRRIDDMRMGINFLLAQRRLCIAMEARDEAEDIKKKALVWNDKMEKDHKAGISS